LISALMSGGAASVSVHQAWVDRRTRCKARRIGLMDRSLAASARHKVRAPVARRANGTVHRHRAAIVPVLRAAAIEMTTTMIGRVAPSATAATPSQRFELFRRVPQEISIVVSEERHEVGGFYAARLRLFQ